MRRRHRVVVPGLRQVLDFCAERPVERVYLEDVARRGAGRFVALPVRGQVRALCHIGANVVPTGADCGAFAAEVGRAPGRMIIGEEGAVAELWAEARPLLPAPRIDRPGQPVYVLETPPPAANTGLREASRADLAELLPACARMHEEEVGEDPMQRDPEGFRRRTEAQIEAGRSWIWLEGGAIRFKAEASAWTRHAVQLQQVWVDPSERGRGYAKRGMSDLCRLLLRRVPRVCLFVRTENAPAIGVYDAIGMRRELTYRSLIF